MAEGFYVDTSIWRDYHESREDKFRPLGEWAFEFFRYCRENNCVILYSDLIIRELENSYSDKEIKEIMKVISNYGLLNKVNEPTKEQYREAQRLKKKLNIPFTDIMHAILARDNKAVMIYRDVHFYELQKIVEIKKPEEII